MWLLLVITFMGPTSPDNTLWQKFPTQDACEQAWKEGGWKTWRYSSHTCIPVGGQ
jgi:hypothetical protein